MFERVQNMILSRNLGHNILKLYNILEKFALTTSKEVLDVYQKTQYSSGLTSCQTTCITTLAAVKNHAEVFSEAFCLCSIWLDTLTLQCPAQYCGQQTKKHTEKTFTCPSRNAIEKNKQKEKTKVTAKRYALTSKGNKTFNIIKIHDASAF